jgi:hypothetical protein
MHKKVVWGKLSADKLLNAYKVIFYVEADYFDFRMFYIWKYGRKIQIQIPRSMVPLRLTDEIFPIFCPCCRDKYFFSILIKSTYLKLFFETSRCENNAFPFDIAGIGGGGGPENIRKCVWIQISNITKNSDFLSLNRIEKCTEAHSLKPSVLKLHHLSVTVREEILGGGKGK